jgi:hypothetical protein
VPADSNFIVLTNAGEATSAHAALANRVPGGVGDEIIGGGGGRRIGA